MGDTLPAMDCERSPLALAVVEANQGTRFTIPESASLGNILGMAESGGHLLKGANLTVIPLSSSSGSSSQECKSILPVHQQPRVPTIYN